MDRILEIARKHNLKVIEDAAHALPARYRGKMIGTVGDITCFSFYATKTITTGEGGMATTDNPEWADRMRMMSLHGISKDAWKRYTSEGSWYYEVVFPGYKYNLTDIAAAMGIEQLKKCDRFREARSRIARIYDDAFENIPEIKAPACRSDVLHAWHLYVIQVDLDRLSIDRKQFVEMLKHHGIGTSVHFIPLHLHPFYRDSLGHLPQDFPKALGAFQRIILSPGLSWNERPRQSRESRAQCEKLSSNTAKIDPFIDLMDTQNVCAPAESNLDGLASISMELTQVNCRVCGSTQDTSLTFFNGFRIARCEDCGFVFVNPRPSEQCLARLYASPERNKYAGDSYEPFEYEFPVLDKILRYVRRYVSSGHLLEVGCGRGDLLKMAVERGFSAQGCDLFGDPQPTVAGATFHNGSLESARLPPNSFDLVVIRNTLEHLFDPRGQLEEIRRILRPGAYMYLKVPNFHFEQGIGCKLVFGKENAFEAPYHLNHFTPTSLKRLLEKSGFKFIGWYVEQPSLRPQWKTNLLRQSGYRIAQGLQRLTAGFAFPKILLSCLAQKTARK